jgi:hypothetical protein
LTPLLDYAVGPGTTNTEIGPISIRGIEWAMLELAARAQVMYFVVCYNNEEGSVKIVDLTTWVLGYTSKFRWFL